MNRLTDKDRFGAFISLGDASAGEWTLAGKFERRLYGDAANRLAAYEDTDLTPEEVMQLRAEQENKPLTLDELREMQGEPVYVIRMQGAKIKMWVIACPNEYGLTQDRNAESQLMAWNTYGRVWLAYRSKPKGEV